MIDLSTVIDVMICPWSTLGRPRVYVSRKTWLDLIARMKVAPKGDPDALIVDQFGTGLHYVVLGVPIAIHCPATGEYLGTYEWA